MRHALVNFALVGCSATSPTPGHNPHASVEVNDTSQESSVKRDADSDSDNDAGCTATDGRLAITARVDPDPHTDRIPMRRVRLAVRNVSADPIRVLRVGPEAFRYGTSSLLITAPDAQPLFAPEPRPHGYLFTEADFVLIAPGAALEFEQSFSLDPMTPGAGTGTTRRPGFDRGTLASVQWTFANSQTAFAGGANTLDGVTKPLFGGGPVPLLWTGELECRVPWTVPD